LSPMESLRFMAMYTLTSLMTPGGKLVALLELVLALLGDLAEHVDLARGHLLDFFDLLDEQRVLFVELSGA